MKRFQLFLVGAFVAAGPLFAQSADADWHSEVAKVKELIQANPAQASEEAAQLLKGKNKKNSDLLICEGMYAEKEKIAKAKQYKHMTFYEAAEVAKKAEVAEMWLTHFSPSLVHAEDYMPQVREIFPNAFLGKDGKSVELMFEDEKN